MSSLTTRPVSPRMVVWYPPNQTMFPHAENLNKLFGNNQHCAQLERSDGQSMYAKGSSPDQVGGAARLLIECA